MSSVPSIAQRLTDSASPDAVPTVRAADPHDPVSRRFCVAPMMDRTDRHCRYFFRLLSRRALLYTEMITAQALKHGDVQRLLGFDPVEHPLALQVGGSEPAQMAQAARLAAEFGYDEVNINVGCPSSRVSSGRFGACLMAEPERVADCVAAMRAVSPLPVTVKTRIGLDEDEGYEPLLRFVLGVVPAGCRTFIVHARKAWLQGLSPEQNRSVPPLRYDLVHRLKREHPELEIIINGGFADAQTARAQLTAVDGVMLGREIYRNPYLLATVDETYYGDPCSAPDRRQVLTDFARYAQHQVQQGARLQAMTRHLSGLYTGLPGARAFRRLLGETVAHSGDAQRLVEAALYADRQG